MAKKESTVTGIHDVSVMLKSVDEQIQQLVAPALLETALNVVARSKELTPVDTGNLRAKQEAKIVEPMAVRIRIGANYAMFVHENLEQKLKGKPRPNPHKGNYWDTGGPKFLEKALRERGDFVGNLSKRISEAVRKVRTTKKKGKND